MSRLKKANKVLYWMQRNVAVQVKTVLKLGLCKSLTLPVLLYGFTCVSASREDLHLVEQFQRKVLKWITGVQNASYVNQLRLLFVLPQPMFIHLRDILTMTELAAVEGAAQFCQMTGELVEDHPEALFFSKTHTEKAKKNVQSFKC